MDRPEKAGGKHCHPSSVNRNFINASNHGINQRNQLNSWHAIETRQGIGEGSPLVKFSHVEKHGKVTLVPRLVFARGPALSSSCSNLSEAGSFKNPGTKQLPGPGFTIYCV